MRQISPLVAGAYVTITFQFLSGMRPLSFSPHRLHSAFLFQFLSGMRLFFHHLTKEIMNISFNSFLGCDWITLKFMRKCLYIPFNSFLGCDEAVDRQHESPQYLFFQFLSGMRLGNTTRGGLKKVGLSIPFWDATPRFRVFVYSGTRWAFNSFLGCDIYGEVEVFELNNVYFQFLSGMRQSLPGGPGGAERALSIPFWDATKKV